MIDLGGSFDKTLNKFGISAAWLSRESGVSQQVISRFRNGKELQTDTLEKLLKPLPLEVKQYFFSQLLGQQFSLNADLLIENLEDEDILRIWEPLSARMTQIFQEVRAHRYAVASSSL
jgi:hypothetical protein